MKRSTKNKIVSGVCAGIAEKFDLDPVWVRIGFFSSALFSFGLPVLLYVFLWFVMPKDE